MTTVLVVHRYHVYAAALGTVVDRQEGLECPWSGSAVDEARAFAADHPIEVAVLDLWLPSAGISRLGAETGAPIVALARDDRHSLERARSLGAVGVVDATSSGVVDLLETIRRV